MTTIPFLSRRLLRLCKPANNHRCFLNIILQLVCLLTWEPAWTADLLQEQEIADEITRTLDGEEAIWLQNGPNKFLGLYRETTNKDLQGAVILLHDLGLNPNAVSVIKPLRYYLPDHGWSTLSLQMPVLETGSTLTEYYDLVPKSTNRILAGIKFLNNQKNIHVAIIGHGLGAVFAVHFLATQDQPKTKALVTIGMPVSHPDNAPNRVSDILVKVDIPFLDIYGNQDRLPRQLIINKRKRLMKNNDSYQQLLVDEADSKLGDSRMIVEKRIYSWLMRVAPGKKIAR